MRERIEALEARGKLTFTPTTRLAKTGEGRLERKRRDEIHVPDEPDLDPDMPNPGDQMWPDD